MKATVDEEISRKGSGRVPFVMFGDHLEKIRKKIFPRLDLLIVRNIGDNRDATLALQMGFHDCL